MRLNGDDPRDFIEFRPGNGRTVELFDIQVVSQRRKGIGKDLVDKLIFHVSGWDPPPAVVYAMTRIDNPIAHQFYEALGFRLLGRLHYFYRDGGDDCAHALVYGKDI